MNAISTIEQIPILARFHGLTRIFLIQIEHWLCAAIVHERKIHSMLVQNNCIMFRSILEDGGSPK